MGDFWRCSLYCGSVIVGQLLGRRDGNVELAGRFSIYIQFESVIGRLVFGIWRFGLRGEIFSLMGVAVGMAALLVGCVTS